MVSGSEEEQKGWALGSVSLMGPLKVQDTAQEVVNPLQHQPAHKNPEPPLFLGSHPTPGHH